VRTGSVPHPGNPPLNSISLAIQDLLDDTEYGLELVLLAGGAGVGHRIHSSRIQKPGLALTGYTEHLHPDRVQVLGNTEISYLRQISEQQALGHIQKLCSYPISCFIVTKGLDPPAFLKAEVEKAGIPLLVTPHQSSTFISLITKFLEERLLPTTHIHGVLVDVLGVGVLILGKSGIGKSECALDLVIRGHRLVADDVVYVKKKMPAALVGQAAEAIQHHMEIRGLGVINIKNLFGVSSIREKKIIDMVIELVEWDPVQEYDRLGLDDEVYAILDVELPHIKIPVRPGRNLTSIIEVAARNHLLKGMGYHSAREFHEKLLARMEVRPLGNEVE
jgi:HPr kinase/phosphorylase